MKELVALLHEDATFSMPPYPLWLRGPAQVRRGCSAWASAAAARASSRSPPTAARRSRPTVRRPGDARQPFALVVMQVEDGRITDLCHYLYPELFPAFGLPDRLEELTYASCSADVRRH